MRERLYRSRTDRILFGVAGGFADSLDIDPALVRIVWALLFFAGGAGLLLYIVAVIVIPEEPWQPALGVAPATAGAAPGPAQPATPAAGVPPGTVAAEAGVPGAVQADPATSWHEAREARRAARRAARGERDGSGVLIFGLILVVIGGWFLFRDLVPGFDDRVFGPGILILLGLVFVVGAMRRRPG